MLHMPLHLPADPRQHIVTGRRYRSHGIRGTRLIKTIRSIKGSGEFQPTPAAQGRKRTNSKEARKEIGNEGKCLDWTLCLIYTIRD